MLLLEYYKNKNFIMTYNYLKKIILNKNNFEYMLQSRKENINYDDLEDLYTKYKIYIQKKESIEQEINQITQDIKYNPDKLNQLLHKVKDLKLQKEQLIKPDLSKIDYIPNFIDKSVPIGLNDKDNQIIRHYGIIQDRPIKPHYRLEDIVIDKAVKMSGSRFTIFKGEVAKLFRALSNFFLEELKKNNFEELIVPYLVLDESMYNTGNLPKFAEDSFKTEKYRLIPTAEVPLMNYFSNETLKDLKTIRVCAFTPCFRSEVGSAGLDTQGIKRLHQFHKVEMVSITTEDNSIQEHENMLNIEEQILQKLNLPYRVVNLCTGDLGFHSSKTYDIEVYMPSIKQYMEISSCSNCLDFQTIRSNIKYFNQNKEKVFAHSLNGSAFPIERMIAAIVENYQNDQGTFDIPKVLEKFYF